jgi:osmoprotectant transport system substrate-binding protein
MDGGSHASAGHDRVVPAGPRYGSLVWMRPSPPSPLVAFAALLVGLLLAGCALVGSRVDADPAATDPVRVAGGPDAEASLLAHVLVAMLELDGLDAEVVPFALARDGRQALELGEVDLRPAYTGEAWLETLGRADPPGDPRESFAAVRAHDNEQGLLWLRPRFGDGLGEPPANATFAFVVAGPPSVDADLRTMSQLAARLSEQPDARVCVDRDFGTRPDGLPAVLAAYSVRSDREFLAADPEEAVAGVVAGDCLAGLTTATDGAAWAAGLVPLVDDLRVFPAFVPLPQLRQAAIREEPAIRTAVAPMASQLTTELLGTWNARAFVGEAPEQIAADAAATLHERAGRRPVPDADAPEG